MLELFGWRFAGGGAGVLCWDVLRPFLALLVVLCVVTPGTAASEPADVFTRDPHSFSRPDEVRVEHLVLDLEVDFARRQLTGTATLRLDNRTGATRLLLDTNGLDVRRITLEPGGSEARFALGQRDPILGRALEIQIAPVTRAVTIHYASAPGAKALQWLEPSMTAGKKHPFLLSQSQAILARTWVPLQDSPQVRFTYEATIRVPKSLLVLMSAENSQSRSADGVYRFRMQQPIPSYLLVIAAGDLQFRAIDSRTGVYAEPAVLESAAREFSDVSKMVSAAEALYGPYRWGRYDLLVLPPSFPFGGMENPKLTFLTPTVIAGDKSLVSVVAHELAHSWSGNLVTNATWNDFWLNEGFTTYFELRILERLYGRDHAEMQWELNVTELKTGLAELEPRDRGLYVNLQGRDPDLAPSTVYPMGALLLRHLEEKAGRDAWDRFLRRYFDRFAFQSMTTDRFMAYLRQELPDVAASVNLTAWLEGPGLPAGAPQPRSAAFDQVEAQAAAFAKGAAASALVTTGWSSHHWLHFLQSLPVLPVRRISALDQQFRFSDSGNAEVLAAWLQRAISAGYAAANPAVERFLTSMGRRKFLVPLYTALAATPDGKAFAKRIYEKSRPLYHPVARESVEAILK